MPLQLLIWIECHTYTSFISVPSIGSMPLQFWSVDANATCWRYFSTLYRVNASTIRHIILLAGSTRRISVPSIGSMPLQYKSRINEKGFRPISVPSIGSMPLQYPYPVPLIIPNGISVPSIGSMPLQCNGSRYFTGTRDRFQYPLSGQCLYNLRVGKAIVIQRTFQYPLSGQCLYNPSGQFAAYPTGGISVPSIGSMPLQSCATAW